MSFLSIGAALTKNDVERFSRQIMVEGIGAVGMERIRRGHVVCVGTGGLGSMIALYLVAAGVGKLTLIDFDKVEVSNLHRQVIHTTARVGEKKVNSAKQSCLEVFPDANIETVDAVLGPGNAEELFTHCDVVVDATDNVAARYVVNDAAMRCGKVLVSGSAMRWEGQLSVYGYKGGPCYRCLFPVPPPPAAVGSCNDSGVVGPVPGMIGCLQALEALKVLADAGEPLSGRLFLFEGLRFSSRVVKLRQKQVSCIACGDAVRATASISPSSPSRQTSHETTAASVSLAQLAASRPEYTVPSCLVGKAYSSTVLTPAECCAASELAAVTCAPSQQACVHNGGDDSGQRTLVVDVRAPIQFGMAHLPHSHSLPLAVIAAWNAAGALGELWPAFLTDAIAKEFAEETGSGPGVPRTVTSCRVLVVCRRGVASAQAVEMLRAVSCAPMHVKVLNVNGGLNAYHIEVDSSFPYY